MSHSKPTNKRDFQKLSNTLSRNKGSRSATAKEYDTNESQILRWIRAGQKKYKDIKFPGPMKVSDREFANAVTDSEAIELWGVYERYGYNKRAVAEATGLTASQVASRIKKAEALGYTMRNLGVTHANSAKKLPLPKTGRITRYILTSLQNNTKLHDETWASLINIAKHYDAEIKVSTFTYIGNDGSAKRGSEGKDFGFNVADRWYDPRAVAYISDDFEQLAPGLVWCGHANTLPTASDPLRGTDSLNGRASGVWPHPRIEMRPVATAAGEATKFNWTTGTIGLRNYLQKRAGITAEFFHCFGGLLVEVDEGGNWWCRQLNADSDGVIYDLDIYSDAEGVWQLEGGIPAINYGDIHHSKIDKRVEAATWGPGGLVDLLEPNNQILEDLLNFNPSHHSRRDPHEMYKQRVRSEDVIYEEIDASGLFLDDIHRVYPDGRESREVVKDANHNRHLDRFLKEVDWRDDLTNAFTILEMNKAWLLAINEGREDDFLAYEWAIRNMGYGKHSHFMCETSEDQDRLSLIVCPERGGGIEVGAHHGHRGANGAQGTPKGFARMGRKTVIGDKHSPGIWGGCYVAGMSGRPRQGYNLGPGSWAPAHVPTYPNGKRQVLLGWMVGDRMLFHAPR